VLDAFKRVQTFLAALPSTVADVTLTPLREEFAAIVNRLTSQGVVQESAEILRRNGTRNKKVPTRALRQRHMKRVADLATIHLIGIPSTKLQLPSPLATSAAMVRAACAMADTIEPYAEVLVKRAGLPADFVAQLRTAAQKVEETISGRSTNKGRKVNATRGVRLQLARGREVVKAIDTILTPELEQEPNQLREWRVTKRVALLGGPRTASSVVEDSPPAATPTGEAKAA
jgi:hypothetical protein